MLYVGEGAESSSSLECWLHCGPLCSVGYVLLVYKPMLTKGHSGQDTGTRVRRLTKGHKTRHWEISDKYPDVLFVFN